MLSEIRLLKLNKYHAHCLGNVFPALIYGGIKL